MLRTFGNKPAFDFPPKTHEQIGTDLGILDFEAASAVSGQKFYFLKKEVRTTGLFHTHTKKQAALLDIGLQNWALQRLVRKGYTPVSTPDLVKHKIAEVC